MSEPRILQSSEMMDLIDCRKFSLGVGFSLVGRANYSSEVDGVSIAKYSLIATKNSITPSSLSSAVYEGATLEVHFMIR